MYFNRERNTAQTSTPTTFVSRSAPQAHPIFLLKPIQYPTPNNPRFNHPATVIRPILSSNINGPIVRPPLVRRFLRPTIIRPAPPRLVINENLVNRVDPVTTIQRQTPVRESPSIESSISTSLSTINSNHEEILKKKTCCYCLPCCQSKEEQSIKTSEKINNRPIYNYPNFKLKTRTIYIIIILLFVLFIIVIILLIVLIAVRR